MRLSFVLALVICVAAVASPRSRRWSGPASPTSPRSMPSSPAAARPRPAALEGLKNDGFKAVINLRQATEPGANIEENAARAKALGLNYIHIPFNGQSPDPKIVDDFLAAVANKANQPVFIHCGSASRVGAVWLVKRVLQDGWPVDKATEEAKLIGLRSAPLEQFALKYIAEHKK